MQEQLASSLRATSLAPMVARAVTIIDSEKLRNDIRSSLDTDTYASELRGDPNSGSRWSMDSDGFLRIDDRIYVPDVNDL